VGDGFRFATGPASPPDVALNIRIIVRYQTQRMAQLMDGDQRSLGRAAGSRSMETADATVSKGVGNSQRLKILGINGQTEFWRYIVFEVPGTLFIAIAGSRRRV
jgi:hypothetical protein